MRCVKKIRVFERSEFRIFSNVLIFQVFWKHWPRLFGYFWVDAKSINGCKSVRFPSCGTASLGKAIRKTALAVFLTFHTVILTLLSAYYVTKQGVEERA